jgi:hypothetical protein
VALTTNFDPIFRRHAGRIPIAFLRALTSKESGFQAHFAMPGGSGAARGLLQVVGCVRADYNRRYKTDVTADELFDPDTNVAIATAVIRQIVAAYARHPSKNLHEDWSNPEFVRLVLAGWNSGFSEGAGVGHVASYLERHGIPVTLDNVFDHAADAGATAQLQRLADRCCRALLRRAPRFELGATSSEDPCRCHLRASSHRSRRR